MLLATGCSFVWGDELDGCTDFPPTHFDKTFAAQLSAQLGIDYKIIACPGNGNQRIFRDLVDYLGSPSGQKVTHLVVMWSYWHREEFAEALTEDEEQRFRLHRDQCMSQVSPIRVKDLKSPLREKYFNIQKHEGYRKSQIMRSLGYMKATKLIADSMGIKLIQGVFHPANWAGLVKIISDESPENIMYNNFRVYVRRTLESFEPHEKIGLGSYTDIHSWAKKKGFENMPDGHPSEETHASYARLLYHIVGKTWPDD